jgi:hypothetical protein
MAFTYSRLASTTVGVGGASAITFSNIPQNYTDLVVKTSTRTNIAQIYGSVKFIFNGSSVSRSYRYLEGNGATAVSGNGTTFLLGGSGTGNSATVNTFANGELYIPNYAGSNYKSVSADVVGENNATTAYATLSADLWSNVTAISQISITTDGSDLFQQYSTATLYGVRVEL